MTTATRPGQVVLYDRATGQPLVRWSVDARELLATDAFTATPPILGESHAAPVTPVDEHPAAPPAPEPRPRGKRGR